MTDTIKNITAKLDPLFHRLPIDVVYLYGSRATGRNDSLSDFDFGILFKERLSEKKRFDLRLQLFGDIANKLQEREDNIDVVDAQEVPILLQFNIICGKIIYNINTQHKIAWETYVLARYHDEHFYLDRYFKSTSEKIRKGVYFERPISHA